MSAEENGPIVRAHIHQALQASVDIDESMPDGSALMGFVVIAEWMTPHGQRWLSCIDSGADPERGCPDWQRQGYLHNALYDHDGFGSAELDLEDLDDD